MVTLKRLHCAQRTKMMIYSDNMITWKHTSNVCRNPKEWLHSSTVRNYRTFSNYNNQQWWRPGSIIRQRRADSARRMERLRDLASLVYMLTLEVCCHYFMATEFLCKEIYQRCKIPQAFQHSGAISAVPTYYQSWPIFDGWAARRKKSANVVRTYTKIPRQ